MSHDDYELRKKDGLINGLAERNSALTAQVAPLTEQRDAWKKRADMLYETCCAVYASIEATDLNGEVFWIVPPYEHPNIHVTASERLAAAIAQGEAKA